MSMNSRPLVRIESQGVGRQTHITNEKGQPIKGISSATVWLDANSVNEVSLTILWPDVEVYAEVTSVTHKCECCGVEVTHECDPATTAPK